MPLRHSRAVAVVLVTFAAFTDIVAYSIAVPVLPHLSRQLGASPTMIGLLFASFGVTLLTVSMPMGAVSDRIGRRPPMIGGLVALAAATLLFAFADSLSWLFAARLVQGAADAVTWVVGFALLADLYGPSERGRVTGIVMSGASFAFMVGPSIGGWLYQIGGMRLPFLTVAAFAVVATVAFIVYEPPPRREAHEPVPLVAVLQVPTIAACAVAVVIVSATMSMLEPVLAIFLGTTLAISPARIGLLFGIAAVVSTTLHPIFGRLADQWGARRLTLVGLAASAVTLALLGQTRSYTSAIPFFVLQAVAGGLVITPSLAYMGEATSEAGIGSFGVSYGLYNFAWGAGLLGGPALGGFLFERMGLSRLALAWAPVLVVAAVLLGRVKSVAMPRPRSIVPLFTIIAAVSVGAQPATVSARAARVHKQAIVLDTHIDTTQFLLRDNWDFFARHDPPIRGAAASTGSTRSNDGNSHVDFPRMREGGLDAAFFSIYMPGTVTGPEAVRRSLLMIDAVHRLAERHPNEVALATTAAEVRAAAKAGKVAALMGMEGGHMIDDNLSVLRDYARLGVRYLTLTHSVNTNWADSSGDKPAHDGLTDFGKDVVRELNRLGVMVDISHVADKTFWDALEISRAPLVASHSSCRAISGHPRNMTDDMIKALAAKGGVIQINYSTSFLSNELYEATQKNVPPAERPSVSWEKIVEHIDHAVKLAGPTHVGLGSDFDGTTVPVGMDDVTQLPKITEALLAKGYSEQDVTNILGGNLLRLMERVEQVARDSRAGMAGEAGRAGAAILPTPFLIIPGLARQNLYPTPNVTLCALSGVSAEIREKR